MTIKPGEIREYHKEGRNHTLAWRMWVKGCEFHTEAGVLGGKMQHTFDVVKAVGKIGTKAHKTPEEQALLVAARKAKKKVEEGYVEIDLRTGTPKKQAVQALDFRSMPKSFASFKPRRQPERDTKDRTIFDAVLEANTEIITIKRDGMMHYVLITVDGDVQIYTRRMEVATAHYPWLMKSFEKQQLPINTLLACELAIERPVGKRVVGADDRHAMSRLSRSKAERAVRLQTEEKWMRPTAHIFAPLVWAGDPIVRDWQVGKWIEFLDLKFGYSKDPHVKSMEIFFDCLVNAEAYVRKHKYEGLVIYNSVTTFGDKAMNFRGKPDRPECWKYKPIFEDDFVVIFDPSGKFAYDEGGRLGKGKLKHSAGRVALYQYDKNGRLTFVSNCGSGFTHDQLADIPRVARMNGGRVGVACVKYVSRTYKKEGAKTNALSEPIFLYWHHDKKDHECLNKRL